MSKRRKKTKGRKPANNGGIIAAQPAAAVVAIPVNAPETLPMAKAAGGSYEDIDVAKLIRRHNVLTRRTQSFTQAAYAPPLTYSGNSARHENIKSFFVDPLALETNYLGGNVRTISPFYGRQISHRILRRVSEKAWIINLCIQNVTKKIRPFLKPATEDNQRGFKIRCKEAAEKKRAETATEQKVIRELEQFFLRTGDIEDDSRDDDIDKYTTKIIRDILQLDQISTELQRTRGGELCAFWAIDTATIEVALPESERETGIKYAQVISRMPYAYYARDELIFDCMNPRTDIEKAGYGYSMVEQSVDLVTSAINTFMYNAGFFTNNNLPRGILLLNGDADTEEIEDIEDYIINLLSGPPSSQWKVPIIPSGKDKNGESGGRKFEWVNLQGTNREMEFQSWYDLQLSAVVSMFGFSMEDLGLHSQKSQPLIGIDNSPKMEATKSLVLGDMLTFLQKHFNKILQYKNPAYELEFVGYERDDPKMMLDIDKSEVESYKTLNEKRAEKGMKPIDFEKVKNPADIPLNSYTVQLFQGQQQGGSSPFGDMGGMGDEGEGGTEGGDFGQDTNEGEPEEGGTGNETEADGGGGSGWDGIEAQHDEGSAVEKSMSGKRNVIRIVI